MSRRRASLVLLVLACATRGWGQEMRASLGYAHIFGAGGFSFDAGYLQSLSSRASSVQQRVGGNFWYANTDVATLTPGNSARDLVGFGARYELELAHCCGRLHPVLAVPLQVLHSSVNASPSVLSESVASFAIVPPPEPVPAAQDRDGSAWGWGTGLELGLQVPLSEQWNVRTAGTALYQEIYDRSPTHGAWMLHVGLSYRFGGRARPEAPDQRRRFSNQ